MWATIMSGIRVYNWLTSSEHSTLSEAELLLPECIFSRGFSECKVCFHCNGNLTNWNILKIFLLNELVLSGRNDKSLCQNIQVILLHQSICKHVDSFLVTIILESNTTRVKRTINNSKTNFRVFTNHVKRSRALIRRRLIFVLG